MHEPFHVHCSLSLLPLAHLSGSNAAEPIKSHSAVSSGVHHPSTAALPATAPSSTSAAPLTSSAFPPSTPPSASTLLSRLALSSTPSNSPHYTSLDAALSHVIPVSISARPVPLTSAENAAEVQRQERKRNKAERRKAEKENSQPEQQTKTDAPADSAALSTTAEAGELEHTNGRRSSSSNDASSNGTVNGTKPRKQRKLAEAKRPLHDDEQLTVTVAQLKAIVAAASEKALRECCKHMTQLSAKQRRELQDSLTKEHATAQSSSLHQMLHSSSLVQAALRQRAEGEQAGQAATDGADTVVDAVADSGRVEQGVAA